MSTFTYPTGAELREIEQIKLPRLLEQRPVFNLFPITDSDNFALMWEQKDNYIGLQQLRGLNGAPPLVKRVGGKRYLEEPGVYGEFVHIDETELTMRRQWASFDQPVNIDDLVAEGQDQLLGRELDRIESMIWTLLVTGAFSVSTVEGSIAHKAAYTTQTASRAVSWATSATATPLADFRAVSLLGRGLSARFDANAQAFMNQGTLNTLLSNTNNADLYGRRTAGLGTFNSIDQINQLFMGDNLPALVPYDEGYIDDTGTFQLFIPDGKVVVVGKRPNNANVGEYRKTRNVNNPSMAAGSYTKIIDGGDDAVPRTIAIHRGHNGGPVMFWPSSVVVLTTT